MQRSHNDSLAVVGGGIAGVLVAQLLAKKGYIVELFEKHSSLGGCAGSFSREGLSFNIGATTIPGLLPGYPVREILQAFDSLDQVDLQEPSMVVYTKKGVVRRYSDLEETIEEINRIFPHKNNRKFWSLIYKVTKDIITDKYYHNFSSSIGAIRTFLNMRKKFFKYYKLYTMPALKGIWKYFGNVDRDYLDFMNCHVKIVAQCSIEEINMITLMLSLGYPFTGIGYAKNSMGSLINSISKDFKCHFLSEINSIQKKSNGYILKGNTFENNFSRIILAMPVFENLKIIEDSNMREYLSRFLKLQSDNSAIVLYGIIEGFIPKELFHLCLLEKPLPYTTSPYLFFSFSTLQRENTITVTISTHTSTKLWKNLSTEEYENRKNLLKEKIIERFSKTFNINGTSVKKAFLATPESFYRYLSRRSVGGVPVKRENTLWRIPSNFTPFKGLYLAGDSFFCYQGWLGVSLGIENLVGNFYEKI